MSTSMTVSEMLESLTGFEEIAIRMKFDHDIFHLLDSTPTTAGRALIFVDKTREGLDHNKAKTAALELRLKEVDDYFAESEDEAMPEEPDTEEGKDDSPDES